VESDFAGSDTLELGLCPGEGCVCELGVFVSQLFHWAEGVCEPVEFMTSVWPSVRVKCPTPIFEFLSHISKPCVWELCRKYHLCLVEVHYWYGSVCIYV
jgi:hypothetical protein